MSASHSQEITQLLIACNKGNLEALEQLTPLVYMEFHHLAKRQMAGERPGHILQTTALVNEAYLRLIEPPLDSRRQFSLSQAATADSSCWR